MVAEHAAMPCMPSWPAWLARRQAAVEPEQDDGTKGDQSDAGKAVRMKRDDMDIFEAITNAGEAPCEKYACQKRDECSDKRIACSSFRWFVQSGKSLDPRMDIPMRRSKFRPPGWNDEIVSTREIFDSIDEL